MIFNNLIFFGIISLLCVESARILTVIPTPSISHQVVFRPLTQELAKRGHEVVVITTDPAFPKGEAPKNLTEIDTHDISYKTWKDVLFSGVTSGKSEDTFGQMKAMMDALSKVFEMQMTMDEVQNLINTNNHYDLLILEACMPPTLALSYIHKAPVIAMSSFSAIPEQYDIVGAPSRPPLLFPTSLHQRLLNLSLREKITELYNHFRFEHFFSSYAVEYEKVLKRLFGPDTPRLAELSKNIDMLFLNVHPMWEFNRPMPPNVIYIGGVNQQSSKELPKDLKTFLDSSKNGVIYISYGTNVSPSSLPSEKIQILVQAFSELPYDVLWKWDKDVLPNRSQNIRISKWLPQSDLLKHPNIKLFITQGGLQSTDEAIAAGVPLIGMPMLGDQWFNVEMYVYHKIGVRLDMDDVTNESFKHAINTVVNDESYRKNIEKLRSVMSDQPQEPLERAVWWTEHLLRHGGASHLKALTANMTWSEYLDLELLAFFGILALAVLLAVGLVARLLYVFVRYVLCGRIKLKKS